MNRQRKNAPAEWCLLLILGLWLAPVSSHSRSPQNSKRSGSAAPAKAAARVADPVVIDAQGYKELVARHRGKPVMVNFWATWCEPCRDEFPMVNELARQYAPQGLVVLAVSLDEDGELNLVRSFLGRVKPVFAQYRKKPGRDEPFINSIHPQWSGAIPATFFYDRDGRVAEHLVGEHRRPEFEKAIQGVLASASGTKRNTASPNPFH